MTDGLRHAAREAQLIPAKGLAVASDVPICEALLERFVSTRPHPMGDVVAEMATALFLRLGVPLDRLREHVLEDAPLPPGVTRDGGDELTTHSVLGRVAQALSSLSPDDRLLLRSTLDYGTPRVLEASERDFPAYRRLGFATVSALVEGSGVSHTVRLYAPEHATFKVVHVNRADVVEAVCRLVAEAGLMRPR